MPFTLAGGSGAPPSGGCSDSLKMAPVVLARSSPCRHARRRVLGRSSGRSHPNPAFTQRQSDGGGGEGGAAVPCTHAFIHAFIHSRGTEFQRLPLGTRSRSSCRSPAGQVGRLGAECSLPARIPALRSLRPGGTDQESRRTSQLVCLRASASCTGAVWDQGRQGRKGV